MELGADLEGTRSQFVATKAQEQHAEEGDTVDVTLQLPGGQQATHAFKLGHTVAFVKLQVEKDSGIPMQSQRLTLGGKPLLDPLSLADCPGISPGAACCITVQRQQQEE